MNHEQEKKNLYSLDHERKKRKKKANRAKGKIHESPKSQAPALSQISLANWFKFFAALLVTGVMMRSCGMI